MADLPAVVRWLVGAFRLCRALHPASAGFFRLAASKSQSFAGACQRHPGRDGLPTIQIGHSTAWNGKPRIGRNRLIGPNPWISKGEISLHGMVRGENFQSESMCWLKPIYFACNTIETACIGQNGVHERYIGYLILAPYQFVSSLRVFIKN
jgi:hypothetical protein